MDKNTLKTSYGKWIAPINFKKLCEQVKIDGHFFVSKVRKNAVILEIESFSLPEDSIALSDKIVYLDSIQNRIENVY